MTPAKWKIVFDFLKLILVVILGCAIIAGIVYLLISFVRKIRHYNFTKTRCSVCKQLERFDDEGIRCPVYPTCVFYNDPVKVKYCNKFESKCSPYLSEYEFIRRNDGQTKLQNGRGN